MTKNYGGESKGKLLFSLAGFLIFLAIALSLETMNLTEFGLDFTTMPQDNFMVWFFGFVVLAFACLFWGFLNR